MRLKAFLCRINWFDGYAWQGKLGQYSFVESISTRECVLFKDMEHPPRVCFTFASMFGLRYIEQVYEEMSGSPSGLNPVVLTTAVKEAIIDCYTHTREDLGDWTDDRTCGDLLDGITGPRIILAWHIATCYLEMGQSRNKNWLDEHTVEEEREKLAVYYDVATTLSKYYAYLIVSAPELLPPKPSDTKYAYNAAAREARQLLCGAKDKYKAMQRLDLTSGLITDEEEESIFRAGVELGRSLEDRPVFEMWKRLSRFWANRLIFAAPSDNVKEHIDRLSRGGEFITHLWALFLHAGMVWSNDIT